MAAPTGVSKPTRGLTGGDVMFLLSLAFVLITLAVTVAIARH
jgi:hypothetical protein